MYRRGQLFTRKESIFCAFMKALADFFAFNDGFKGFRGFIFLAIILIAKVIAKEQF